MKHAFSNVLLIASFCLTVGTYVPATVCAAPDVEPPKVEGVESVAEKGPLWITIDLSEPDRAKHAAKCKAAIPYTVAERVLKSLPKRLKQEALDEGFDLANIHKLVIPLKPGKKVDLKAQGYKLALGKEHRKPSELKTATYLRLKVDEYGIDFSLPLALAPAIVSLLTGVFDDLEGLDKPLLELVAALKELPPGKLVAATDGYSAFEIELK